MPSTRRNGTGRAVFVALIASMGAFTASPAQADQLEAAEHLFQEARALVDKGDYAAACPKLEMSQKLEPAVGTQFNLADCYEHVGRPASAYVLFGQVAAIARSAGKFERERSARERAKALEPRIGRIRYVVTAPAPGEELHLDDSLVDRSTMGEPSPLDPGVHTLRATAPERTPWQRAVTVTAGESAVAVVPALVDPRPRTAPPAPPRASSPQKTVAVIAAGAGVVGIGVGVVAGIVALGNRSDAQSACPEETYRFRCPSEAGTSAWNSAAAAGTLSTIGFVVGSAALAAAGVLWFTAPSSRGRVGVAASGVRLEGTF